MLRRIFGPARSLVGADVLPTKNPPLVTVVTAGSAWEVSIAVMRGESPLRKNLCPACGRLMDLTRTIAASPGYSELRTYGCRECGVWVTEESTPKDLIEHTLAIRRPSSRRN